MMTEDLDAFLSTDEHALEGTYNGATAVKVIFDAAYAEAFGVSGTDPVALGKASDFPAAAVGRTLALAGVTYTIRRREPVDDGAFVRLALETP